MADLAAVASWISSAERCLQWAGLKVGFPIQPERLAQEIQFRNSESRCLVESGGLIAFGQILAMAGGRQHLARLIVDPKLRGRGVGRELTKHLLELALAKSPSSVSLNVFLDNLAAGELVSKHWLSLRGSSRMRSG